MLVFLLLTALAAVEAITSPGPVETALQCGLAVGGFGAMAGWARRNRTALDQQDWCDCAGPTITMRVISSHRPEPPRGDRADERTPSEETLEEVAR